MNVYPFQFDASIPVVDVWMYNTSRMEGIDGVEQVRQIRDIPSRMIQFRALLDDTDGIYRAVHSKEWNRQNVSDIVRLPLWFNVTPTTQPVDAMDATLYCDTLQRGFVNGGWCVIWKNEREYVLLQIAATGADYVQVSAPCGLSGAAGAIRIAPAVSGRFIRLPKAKRYSQGVFDGNGEFKCLEADFFTVPAIIPSAPEYRDEKVLLFEPNNREGADFEYLVGAKEISNPIGTFSTLDLWSAVKDQRTFLWTALDRTEILELNGWMQYLKGRFQAVWLPTYDAEFRGVSLVGNVLKVENDADYSPTDTSQDIMIWEDADNQSFARVVSVAPSGAQLDLTLDASLSVTRPIEQCHICLLQRMALSQDRIEMKYLSTDIVETSLRFQSVFSDPVIEEPPPPGS